MNNSILCITRKKQLPEIVEYEITSCGVSD